MISSKTKVLVTGGCGFIGSHLVTVLMRKGVDVVVLDNLTTGSVENIKEWLDKPNFRFLKGDLLNELAIKDAIEGRELVFHLSANPEVRIGVEDTRKDLEQNILATYNLLEAMRRSPSAKTLIFTSTSTVYGDAPTPTQENHGPLFPISLYGASKLSCEALISAYCHLFEMKAAIYRFANIVGPRGHGVIQDFIRKLSANPRKLEILGDGTQTKSYLYVDDCIEAILSGLEHMKKPVEVFNIGSEDQVAVEEIARIVAEEMGLKNVEFHFTGGVNGGRGWKGDVKNMFLNINKLKERGWKPRHKSSDSIRMTVRAEIQFV